MERVFLFAVGNREAAMGKQPRSDQKLWKICSGHVFYCLHLHPWGNLQRSAFSDNQRFVGRGRISYAAALCQIWQILFALVPSPTTWIAGPDVNAWINNSSIKKYFTESEVKLSPFWAEFLTAWALTKTTEPLRIIGTAAALPVVVRYMPARLLQVFGINKAASTAAMGRVVTRAREARTAVRTRVGQVSGHVTDTISRTSTAVASKVGQTAPKTTPKRHPSANER